MPVKRWSEEHRAKFMSTMATKRKAIPQFFSVETYDIREMSTAQIKDFNLRLHKKICLELKIKWNKEAKEAGVTLGAVMTTPLNGRDD